MAANRGTPEQIPGLPRVGRGITPSFLLRSGFLSFFMTGNSLPARDPRVAQLPLLAPRRTGALDTDTGTRFSSDGTFGRNKNLEVCELAHEIFLDSDPEIPLNRAERLS